MSLSFALSPFTLRTQKTQVKAVHFHSKPNKQVLDFWVLKFRSTALRIRSSEYEHSDHIPPGITLTKKPKWENVLSAASSLYPLYVTVGGIIAWVRPSTFAWFSERGPTSYSLSLGLIMLAMGLTLELKDLLGLFLQRPLSILFGCAAQYTIMPTFGWIVSQFLGLSPFLFVGLILLACCPGGTASNVVTLIARADVPLSIVMTVCTTLGAMLLTPLLTKFLAGTYVPVDAVNLSISTLQIENRGAFSSLSHIAAVESDNALCPDDGICVNTGELCCEEECDSQGSCIDHAILSGTPMMKRTDSYQLADNVEDREIVDGKKKILVIAKTDSLEKFLESKIYEDSDTSRGSTTSDAIVNTSEVGGSNQDNSKNLDEFSKAVSLVDFETPIMEVTFTPQENLNCSSPLEALLACESKHLL